MPRHRRSAIAARFIVVSLAAAVLLLVPACEDSDDEGVEPPADSGGDVTAGSTDEDPSEENVVHEPAPEGKVLRHAVFFQFNEDSTDEQIAEVVEAFEGLPEKIDAIRGFEWGVNNSPEGLDDGFTHCFLLTFDDGAGRAEYLPHDDHRAFGDVLRPHMKDVFVVDYWGTPAEDLADRVLRHAVFFKFKDDADPEDVEQVEAAFAALPDEIDEIQAFEWGTNNSPESYDDDFTHCFLVTFASEDGRAVYLEHEAHQAFVEVLQPVLDKVRVLDYWAEP